MLRRLCLCLAGSLLTSPLVAAELPKVKNVELQPLAAQAKRIVEALDLLGSPLPDADKKALASAKDVNAIQTVLDKHCLAGVRVPGSSDKKLSLEVAAGPAAADLAEQGWRVFLVKVHNVGSREHVELRPESPNAAPLFYRSTSKPDPTVIPIGEVGKRFLELSMFNAQPLVRDLAGLELEYRILQIYCRDPGRKEATLGFSLWRELPKKKPTDRPQFEKLADSNEVGIFVESSPAVVVELKVKDWDGKPVMGSFTFRDAQDRVYPSQSRRLAPDLGFHPQIYRTDGETVLLQPGKYKVTYTRGPEYLVLERTITVPASRKHTETFELKRWIHPLKKGWYSGDHHVHAAGCAHYESPTEGVTPEDMMRHILGEDLNVGCCLSWGPCWYHQKRYFEGKVHKLSTPDHLLRYDVEVSGFPSSHAGHICLLRLREQDYPGTKLISDWPSWDLPIFQWAKAQGGVVGFAHSGWGLAPDDPKDPTVNQLPNYVLPKMDGIGANEYLVDVAHGACDFISTVDTPILWELNIWYHTLNCGYRCRISGETDFPCIYGERVGLGRSYVHLNGKLNFDDWAEGIKQGRCYVSDGLSHLMDYEVNGVGVGLKKSEVKLSEPGKVKIKAKAAAWLEPKPTPETEKIRGAPSPKEGNSSTQTLTSKPYWHVERSRVGDTRRVPVEVVVNGYPVDKKEIIADGTEQEVTFEVPIKYSSWVCLRIFPSSHTNPVFAIVDDKPIRASKRSAEWCLKSIDKCWEQKKPKIREKELQEAETAYDKARIAYKKVLAESVAD
ncbi:MAG: CehA/McbA family metallohydrolase [Gemmataceae bacterium]|nr:CehA/McbA family metallohydrolase [Gemmataceae bacterium]